MLPSYESPLRFQEGWSSLQTHSRTPRNPPRGLTLQMGMLGNLKARTALRMCSKNLQLAANCGSWASLEGGLAGPPVDDIGEFDTIAGATGRETDRLDEPGGFGFAFDLEGHTNRTVFGDAYPGRPLDKGARRPLLV